MASDVAPDRVRIFAVAGVGHMASGRWYDVPRSTPNLEAWLAAGLVQTTGPQGQPAPARLPGMCCGARRP